MSHVPNVINQVEAIYIDCFSVGMGEVMPNTLNVTRPPNARMKNNVKIYRWHWTSE